MKMNICEEIYKEQLRFDFDEWVNYLDLKVMINIKIFIWS